MKQLLIFITAFLFSIAESIYYLIPMAYDFAMICVNHERWRWEIPDDEFLNMIDTNED